MRKKTIRETDVEERRQIIFHTAQAQANALHGMYRDTLTDFMSTPSAIPVPRAARAMFWLGRLRQWRAIELNHIDTCAATNWLSLQLGVVESLAGTHALALHKEQWSGPTRRHTYDRDMSLQLAMLLALGWRDLATFAVRSWFGTEGDTAAPHTLNGMTGMIVVIAGQALGVDVPQAVFHKSDALLARLVAQWQADDDTFMPLAFQLANRHLMQSGRDSDTPMLDFDHPVEQSIPVELLMLLRLRGRNQLPDSIAMHPALSHPAAILAQAGSPVQSQRCTGFIERVIRVLPQYRGLVDALQRQALHTGECAMQDDQPDEN